MAERGGGEGAPERPAALRAEAAAERQSNYPAPFAARVAGRSKRPLGDPFGLTNFGVNLTTLAPGAATALHHVHTREDEFVYILAGRPTLITDGGETLLGPGDCAGFPAGGTAHHLENRSAEAVVLLEVGDRTPGDEVRYPEDDLAVTTAADGTRIATRKDGRPW